MLNFRIIKKLKRSYNVDLDIVNIIIEFEYVVQEDFVSGKYSSSWEVSS